MAHSCFKKCYGSLLAAFTIWFFTSVATMAANQMTADEALKKAEAGEIIVLDIRSRAEWGESGIASVAEPVSMHERDFLERYTRIRAENPDKPIALICATGGRSQWLQTELSKRGLPVKKP